MTLTVIQPGDDSALKENAVSVFAAAVKKSETLLNLEHSDVSQLRRIEQRALVLMNAMHDTLGSALPKAARVTKKAVSHVGKSQGEIDDFLDSISKDASTMITIKALKSWGDIPAFGAMSVSERFGSLSKIAERVSAVVNGNMNEEDLGVMAAQISERTKPGVDVSGVIHDVAEEYLLSPCRRTEGLAGKIMECHEQRAKFLDAAPAR